MSVCLKSKISEVFNKNKFILNFKMAAEAKQEIRKAGFKLLIFPSNDKEKCCSKLMQFQFFILYITTVLHRVVFVHCLLCAGRNIKTNFTLNFLL